MNADERAARERLAKLLRLGLDTGFAGERDNALAKACQLAEKLGGWDRLLGVEPPTPWRVVVADLLRHPALLNDWEARFLATIRSYPADRALSDKQTARLADIARQVEARQGCPV